MNRIRCPLNGRESLKKDATSTTVVTVIAAISRFWHWCQFTALEKWRRKNQWPRLKAHTESSGTDVEQTLQRLKADIRRARLRKAQFLLPRTISAPVPHRRLHHDRKWKQRHKECGQVGMRYVGQRYVVAHSTSKDWTTTANMPQRVRSTHSTPNAMEAFSLKS